MQALKAIFSSNTYALHSRQSRLIVYITCELLLSSATIIFIYSLSKLWYMASFILISCIIALLNLGYLVRSKNTKLCSHILTSLTLLTIIIANYFVGGTATPYSIWFYVIPLIAVSLLGWSGLVIYSTLSLLMIIVFGTLSIHPFYHLVPNQIVIIEWANHLAAYLIIVTTLASLMQENMWYEKLLTDKNYLLQVDKDKYHYLARFDPLTNLPNRQYFQQKLEDTMDSLPTNHCITVFFMDLDKLKYINDHFGHEAGDHLLRQTARRLQICFRENDFIARLGGDEFTALVVHGQGEDIPKEIAKRIKHEFNQTFTFENIVYHSSISIGLATYPNDAQTTSDLMAKADIAMYAAKKGRRVVRKTI